MLFSLSLLTLLGMASAATLENRAVRAGYEKPRVIVLTDITPADWEPDDMQSMIHLLASADMYDIQGLISTTGYSIGDNTDLKTYIIKDMVNLYEKDLPNLMKRSGQSGFQGSESNTEIGYWPSPGYLRSVIKEGIRGRGMDDVGDGKGTSGSNHIIDVVDRSGDNRPVWVGLWGGGNTLAQAIWDVRRSRSSSELNKFLSKLRVFAITDQDRNYTGEGLSNSSQSWMRKTFTSNFFYIWSYSAWGTYGSTIKSSYWNRYTKEIQGKGNLGKSYPKWKYIVEGDTPAWLHMWPGLNDPSDPTQYSYGGYYQRGNGEDGTPCWLDRSGNAASRSNSAIKNTLPDSVNDFVSRLDWASKGSGNRNPKVVLGGEEGYKNVVINVKAGSTATISAAGTKDPDGNSLKYTWSHDSGTGYTSSVSVNGNGQSCSVNVPSGARGKEIHVVLRVLDNGSPALASYRRAVLKVS